MQRNSKAAAAWSL